MGPNPTKTPHAAVTISYHDARGRRLSRTFESPIKARRFFVFKFNANRNPRVEKP